MTTDDDDGLEHVGRLNRHQQQNNNKPPEMHT